jgi:MFS superfamily sulfate permease-like transporter
MARHPENEALPGIVVFRPEASLLYINADSVLEAVRRHVRVRADSTLKWAICDLSASPYIDLAGCRALHVVHEEFAARGIALRIVGARGRVRDLLRADGLGEKVGGLERTVTLDSLLAGLPSAGVPTPPPPPDPR